MKKIIVTVLMSAFISAWCFGEQVASEQDLFEGIGGQVLNKGDQEQVSGGLGPVGGAIVGAAADFTVQMINNKGDITKTDVGSLVVSAGIGAATSGISAGAALLAKNVTVAGIVQVAKSEAIIKSAGDVVSTVGAAAAGGIKKDVTTTTTSTSSSGTKTVTVTTTSKSWWSW